MVLLVMDFLHVCYICKLSMSIALNKNEIKICQINSQGETENTLKISSFQNEIIFRSSNGGVCFYISHSLKFISDFACILVRCCIVP